MKMPAIPVWSSVQRWHKYGPTPIRRPGRPKTRSHAIFGIMLAVFMLALAAFLGLASAFLPPFFVVAVVAIPTAIIIGATNTELLFVAAMLAIYGVIPRHYLPALPLGGARIRPGELLLLVVFGFSLFAGMYKAANLKELLKPVFKPLALFAALLAVSFMYGVVYKKNAYGLAEARGFVGWVALFIVLYYQRWRPERLEFYIRVMAVLVSIILVVQTVFGVQIIMSERAAESLSQEFSDVVRSSAGPGIYIVMYTLLYCVGSVAWLKKSAPLNFVLALVMVLGIGATFGRGIWAATAVAPTIFIATTGSWKRAPGFIIAGLIGLSLAVAGALIAKPKLGEALIERVTSITEEGGRGSSVGFRFDENHQAMTSMRAHPLLGVGIGGEYKEYSGSHSVNNFTAESTYIHNGYLALGVKVGVLGVLFPVWLIWATWQLWKRRIKGASWEEHGPAKLSAAAAVSTLVGLGVSSLTQPEWNNFGGTATIATLLAFVLTAAWRVRDSVPEVEDIKPKRVLVSRHGARAWQ